MMSTFTFLSYFIYYISMLVLLNITFEPVLSKFTTLELNKEKSMKLRGVVIEQDNVEVNTFYGIPYAKPPVGKLRFADPIKHEGWKGEKDATQPPNSCYQADPYPYEKLNPALNMWIANTNKSEDCLYLNVWAPNKVNDKTLKSVLVWIYGGSFLSGTSTLDVYDGSILASKENVIVVSMQYRVGAFGFLQLNRKDIPESQGKLAKGNQGLKDQRLALVWVKENIEKFGGDPDKVTLFGESAGSASVSAQWLSPYSRYLFKRAAMQSASIFGRWAYDDKKTAHKKGEMASH